MGIKLKPLGVQAAVVFGASSGIGRLTALEFAGRGAKVVVAARSEEGLKSLVEEIERNGGEAFYIVADVSDFNQVKGVAEKTVERFGRIDTWVHAAGVCMFATVEQTEPEEYARIIEINLLGQIYGAKASLPYLKKSGGALIHVSSVEAFRTIALQSAYGASKHGIKGFIQALRSEIKHEGSPVSITEILPGPINTPIYDKGRNKISHKPRPIPPIYHPKIVSDTIVYAAENPVDTLIAGGSGAMAVYGERFSPRIAEWFTTKIGFFGQKTGIKENGEHKGSLFEPIPELDTIEGRFSGEQFKSDPYTYLQTHPKLKTGLLALTGGLIGGLIAWRASKAKR